MLNKIDKAQVYTVSDPVACGTVGWTFTFVDDSALSSSPAFALGHESANHFRILVSTSDQSDAGIYSIKITASCTGTSSSFSSLTFNQEIVGDCDVSTLDAIPD